MDSPGPSKESRHAPRPNAASNDLTRAGSRALMSQSFLSGEVDPSHRRSTVLLAAFSFMTGLMCAAFFPVGFHRLTTAYVACFTSDAVSFTAIFVWCGFQTGNFVQVQMIIDR